MIICPVCKTEITIDSNTIHCSSCSHCIEKIDGIWIFNPEITTDHDDYNADYLPLLFEFEEKHFWFSQRRNIIKYFINKYVQKNSSFIEIGAGTCNISRMLNDEGFNVSVGDIHKNGLEIAKSFNIKNLYQFDLYKPPFNNHFDVLGLFDVLEHLEEEEEAITNIRKILNNKGLLILTVPAHMWLWNQFDEIARHKRRYSLSDLKKLLSNNCFNVLEAKNFFVSIIPLLLVRKILHNKLNYEPDEKILDSNLKINPLVNSILGFVGFLEFKILKYLPCKIGGSIIIIAQKEG